MDNFTPSYNPISLNRVKLKIVKQNSDLNNWFYLSTISGDSMHYNYTAWILIINTILKRGTVWIHKGILHIIAMDGE